MKKVLLYSGGMDSWLLDKIWKPDIRLYVNMHTKYSESELQRIRKCGEDVTILDFPLGMWEREDAIIPLRNMYLIMAACNITGEEDVEVCFGATAGDRILDQGNEFANKACELLNYLYQPQHWIPKGKNVRVVTFKHLTKTQMLRTFLDMGGDINEAMKSSLSCYNSHNDTECWSCKPCFRKFVAFDVNGYKFTNSEIKTAIKYMREHIAPELSDGKLYRCESEDSDIRFVLDKYKDLEI